MGIEWTEQALQDLHQRLENLRNQNPTAGPQDARYDQPAKQVRWGVVARAESGPAHNYRVRLCGTSYDKTTIGADYGGLEIKLYGDGTKDRHYRIARCLEPMLIPMGTLLQLELKHGQWFIDHMPAPKCQFILGDGGPGNASITEISKGYVGVAGIIPNSGNRIVAVDTLGCLADGMVDGNKGHASWVNAWSSSSSRELPNGYWSIDSLCCVDE